MKAGLLALHAWLLTVAPSALSVPLLLDCHRELSAGVARMLPGEVRRQDITFGSFLGTAPERIVQELDQLVFLHHERWSEVHAPDEALVHAAWLHAELVRIHPVWDGNGRLARAVGAWLCWAGGSAAPLFPDQRRYFAAISRYCHTRDVSLLVQLSRETLPG